MKILKFLIRPLLLLLVILNMAFFIFKTMFINVPLFYQLYYKITNVSLRFDISSQDVFLVYKRLLNYLNGFQNTLQTNVIINNKNVPFFSANELQHMSDVKQIYFYIYGFNIILFFIITFLIIKNRDLIAKNITSFFNSLYYSTFMLVGTICTFLLLLLLNFKKIFHFIHIVFFKKGTWIFNPATEHLIELLPTNLFLCLGISYFYIILHILVTLLVVSKYLRRRG